jgi:hypothetical protein
MLAVASDRFPRCGAVAISIMGGIGMMSAGLVGSPGLGYAKDRFSGEALQKANPAAYAEYKASTSSKWLFFDEVKGIDGQKARCRHRGRPGQGSRRHPAGRRRVLRHWQPARPAGRLLHPGHHGRDLPAPPPLLQGHRRL